MHLTKHLEHCVGQHGNLTAHGAHPPFVVHTRKLAVQRGQTDISTLLG